MMRWIFIFAFSLLFAKESVDFLFYLQDAGETHALLPVVEKLEARGHKVALLTAGVASQILKAREPWTFSDLRVKIDRNWERSRLLKEEEIARLALELQPRVVVTGVAFASQGQVLDFYRSQGVPTFAFWDNFQATGENPYFETASSVAQKASDLLLPSEELHCHLKGKVVGHPSLEQWKERIELIDRQEIRKSLRLSDCQSVALWIGGYGKEYEESFSLFLDCVERAEEEFVFLIQPHPKFGGESERKILQEKNLPIRLLEGVDTIEAVAAADLVLLHQSTVAFQALSVSKPVFHLIPAHQSFDSVLLQKGLVKRIASAEEFLGALSEGLPESEQSLFEVLGIPTQSASLCAEVLLEKVPHLQMTPQSGLSDEALCIRAGGLEPHQKFFIRSHLLADRGEGWTAWALFEADARGEVDLAQSIPQAGTYRKADPMGLIWSMIPDSGEKTLFRSEGDKMSIEFTLEVEGQIADRIQVERKKGVEMQRIPVRERGLVGTLFLPPSEKLLPAVIVLSGSGGGLSEGRAQTLASHGFAAFALAYFGCEHLPKTLEEIPLEYFDTAIEWLKEHPAVESERVGLWGVSRGAEAALLIGATFPEKIQAIAAYVPSSALYSSSLTGGKPAWIYQEKPLSRSAPFPFPKFSPEEGLSPEKAIALTPIFLEGMKDQEAFAAAAIPVEKIECPLLLVSGQDDQMWPSALFAEQIVQRLKEKGSSIPCSHLSYPGAGHHISPPYIPTTTSAELHPIAKLWFAFGGNPEDTSFARADSWEKTVQFFKTSLCSD